MTPISLTLSDGKYTLIVDDSGMRCLRHGQEWRTLTGDGMVLALAQEIESMRATLEYVRGLGEVYVYPSDWRCHEEGGPPPMEAYEKIDLADIGSIP